MIHEIQAHYIGERVKSVDPDFLQYEEEAVKEEDLVLVSDLLSPSKKGKIKLPNPHNSMILVPTGISD